MIFILEIKKKKKIELHLKFIDTLQDSLSLTVYYVHKSSWTFEMRINVSAFSLLIMHFEVSMHCRLPACLNDHSSESLFTRDSSQYPFPFTFPSFYGGVTLSNRWHSLILTWTTPFIPCPPFTTSQHCLRGAWSLKHISILLVINQILEYLEYNISLTHCFLV